MRSNPRYAAEYSIADSSCQYAGICNLFSLKPGSYWSIQRSYEFWSPQRTAGVWNAAMRSPRPPILGHR